jgi:hypothetical protein
MKEVRKSRSKLESVAHACNPNYLGGWDQEDNGSRPALANSSQEPISKITRAKWTGGLTQTVECLLGKHKALNLNPSSNPQKNNRKRFEPASQQNEWEIQQENYDSKKKKKTTPLQKCWKWEKK